MDEERDLARRLRRLDEVRELQRLRSDLAADNDAVRRLRSDRHVLRCAGAVVLAAPAGR